MPFQFCPSYQRHHSISYIPDDVSLTGPELQLSSNHHHYITLAAPFVKYVFMAWKGDRAKRFAAKANVTAVMCCAPLAPAPDVDNVGPGCAYMANEP